jgi:hypothetical protein
MTLIRPAKIEAALLYQDYKPFAYAYFVDRLKLVFGDDIPVTLGGHQDGSFGIINAGGIIIKISQNQGPLGQAGFQGALSSSYTKLEQPDAEKTVQSHCKNIFVTVGGDSVLLPDLQPGSQSHEMLAMVAPPEEVPGVVLFSNRVHIARLVVSQLIALNKPDLIHWCQSDQVLKPEQMSPADDPRGMALQIHPSLFSSGVDENGSQKIGFHAFGSEHVTGQHVFVEETPFALSGVIEVANDFIYSLTKTCELPKNGSVVRMKSGAVLRVTQAAADYRFPRNYLLVEMLEPGTPAQRSSKPDSMTRQPARRSAEKTSVGLARTSRNRNIGPLQKFTGIAAVVLVYFVGSKFLTALSDMGVTTLASN